MTESFLIDRVFTREQETSRERMRLFGVIACVFLPLPFTPQTVTASMFPGILTGSVAAFGYFYCYRALEAGPIALVSPLTSTSSVFTLLLALVILRQGLTRSAGGSRSEPGIKLQALSHLCLA